MVKLSPNEVVSTLRKHMLVDGYSDMIVDLKKSHGCMMHDSLQDRDFLDLFGFFATVPIGHNHPGMHDDDFKEQLLNAALMKPSNSDFYTLEMGEFVEVFSKHAVPRNLPHLFFVSGGALAVENALKAAFDWKVRKNFEKGVTAECGTQVIHFRGAFHGRSGYTLSLTNTDPAKTKYFPKFSWPRIINPKLSFPLNDERVAETVELEKQAVQEIKSALQQEGDDIAALIIEPIQGEGGDNHFRKEFFQQLRTLANENDVMLIFDEIQTGVGLTGKMWCFEHFGVEPDMICFGKKTQVCGFLCSDRIKEVENNVFEESSRINSTWGGNLVDMVRCKRYLEIIAEENMIENAGVVGDYLKHKLIELGEEFPEQISNVRGRGLMIAFDLPDPPTRARCLDAFYKEGLIALSSGERAIRFRPALNLSQEYADQGVAIMAKAFKEIF